MSEAMVGETSASETAAFLKLQRSVQHSVSCSFSGASIGGSGGAPRMAVFRVSTAGLAEVFLAAMAETRDRRDDLLLVPGPGGVWRLHDGQRQAHNCRCCLAFIREYGGLVTIDEAGRTRSLMWQTDLPDRDGAYPRAMHALCREVEKRAVQSQFFWERGKLWGRPTAGGFDHLFVDPPVGYTVGPLRTVSQMMGESRELHHHLSRALLSDWRFTGELLERAVQVLRTGELARSEALLPMAEFLRQTRLAAMRQSGEARKNVLWRATAVGATGWCTPRRSALAALLSGLDRVSGLDRGETMGEVKRAHDARLAPGSYQRPKATPSGGAIDRAERIVASLGLERAFARRALLASEAEYVWGPPPAAREASSAGVFGHLRGSGGSESSGPRLLTARPVERSFDSFLAEVLPEATTVQMLTPVFGSFGGFLTAVDPSAPPIVAWDRPERRNPVSWYVYLRDLGREPRSWGLAPATWVEVRGFCALPFEWYGGSAKQFSHLNPSRRLVVLRGARDQSAASTALFPRHLRPELHEVRSVIEAHSRATARTEVEGEHASGYLLAVEPQLFRVQTQAGLFEYRVGVR